MGGMAAGVMSGLASGINKKKRGDSGDDDAKDAKPSSYSKGGKVKRSGRAKVHKGERVLTKKQTRKYEKKRGSKR